MAETAPTSGRPEGPVEVDARAASRPVHPAAWVSSTYFAEGFPYAIVNNLAEVLFVELGASLRAVGLTSLFHLPWNLKFLWGPLLDQYETKRRWLLASEVALSVALGLLAIAVARGASLGVLSGLFLLTAFVAATHDIAVDGFYLEGLDEVGQPRFVGVRAMAYKVASLVVRGPLIILAGWSGWSAGLAGAFGVMVLLTVAHALIVPRVEQRAVHVGALCRSLASRRTVVAAAIVALLGLLERSYGFGRRGLHAARAFVEASPTLEPIGVGGWIGIGLLTALLVLLALRRALSGRLRSRPSHYGRAFLSFLAQPQVGVILAFVVLFRAGESMLQKMKWPFLRDVVQLSLERYGFANGTLGVVASFLGTLVGGWLIARHGLRRWIWPFVLAQNVLNLLYVGLGLAARSGPPALGFVTSVITLEHFGEGLGTAVFMVFLMRCCDPAHKAAHMAVLTALMSVSFTLAGVSSGYVAQAIGFVPYFAASFVATIPAMVLIAWLPHLDARPPASAPAP